MAETLEEDAGHNEPGPGSLDGPSGNRARLTT